MKRYQDKKWLRTTYWDEQKNTRQMAALCGVCKTTILNWMRKHGITRRTYSEAKRGRLCTNWGKHPSIETRRKMGEAQRKYPPVIICIDCGQKKKHCAHGLCATCCNRHWREEHREERKAYRQRYYQKHREELLAENRRWREKNRDYNKLRLHRWQQQNPEKVRANSARRRALRRKTAMSLTGEQAERLLAIGRLLYPGEELHLDHLVPLSKGGGTTLANMTAIPASLNIAKRDRLPEEVYEQLSL